MARSSQPSSRDASMSPSSAKSREYEIPNRWSEYLGAYWNVGYEGKPPRFAASQKGLNLQWLIQLTHVSRGLLAKMYSLTRILDSSDPLHHSDAFWRSGVFPNSPRICNFLSKKFPEHHSKLQLERVDKDGLETLNSNGELHLQNLECWFQLLVDLITFREQALQIILDLSSTVITLLPHQNSIILHAFMDIFCSLIRVNIFSEKIPRKMILQVYNLLHSSLRNDRECDFYHRLVQYIDSYDPPLKGLQEDLNFVGPRIGEVLEAVGPVIFLSTDTRKLRNEGFLSPFHPRYPDILTNSAHPMRAQDLANVTSYREWVLLGYLVCPDELLRMTSIDIAAVVLKENLIMELFRDEHIQLHEEYQSHVLPRILESKKIAKAGRTKQKEAEIEYSISKQVEKMLSDAQEQSLFSCEAIHRERRMLLKQEIGKMVLFFSDQPSLLAPNIQMVFSTLALSRSEILWYFQHVGIAGKSKVTRVVPVNIDPNDPTIGFLVDGMYCLGSLVRKYSEAIKGYALSHILSSPGRIRFLMNTPGMIALDIDENLQGLFQLFVQHLENIPKPQGDSISSTTYDFSDLRKSWVSILMIISSVRSSINVRHLERATVSTGKEGLMFEGNAAYNWSRCVDDLEFELVKHGSLKKLYFFHQHLTSVFKNTMFGPEGRPQHCCAWLAIATSFPDCASPVVPDEVSKIGRDAVSYVEWVIESIMGGLEGLINILDSEGGFGGLDMQLLPEQAVMFINYTPGASLSYSSKSPKSVAVVSLPGHESYPESCGSTKMLEGALQRLTGLCSVLNDMEPICVLNHVFVLREFMRDCILGNFRRRLLLILKASDDDIQRPSIMKSLLCRHMMIVHLCEHNVIMDLTQGIREVLLTEIFTGPVSSLHLFQNTVERSTGFGTEIVCDWYIDKIIKDVSGAGLLYSPARKYFKSVRPVGVCLAESITDMVELKAFVHIFGGYGVDRLHRMLTEHMEDLLNSIKMALRSNSEVLEAFSKSVCSGYGMEKEASFIQIAGMETVIGFCTQVGQTVAFHSLLAEAAGSVLEEDVPLLYSLLSSVGRHLPNGVRDKEITRMREVSTTIGVGEDHDFDWIRSIIEDNEEINDDSWRLLPYLFASFMGSSIWMTSSFDIHVGGFDNNIHCLARCISCLIAGSESIRSEKEKERQQSFSSDGHGCDTEEQNHMSIEDRIKSAILIFVKLSALATLDSWNEGNRSEVVARLIFLDQLCEVSPYLSRSSLEAYIPYAIIGSIYSQYYANSLPLHLPPMSPSRWSPLLSTPSHHSPRGDATPKSASSSSHLKSHENHHHLHEGTRVRGLGRMSGPLEYIGGPKLRGVEGRGPNPLPRFAVSRSGPVSYK